MTDPHAAERREPPATGPAAGSADHVATPAAPAPADAPGPPPQVPGERQGSPRSSGLAAIILGGLAVVVLAAAGAFTAYWFFAIATLEEQVADWIEQHQADGFRIAHGPPQRGGFPARLRLTLPEGTISAPAGWAWSSPRTVIETELLAPDKVSVAFAGDQSFRLPPAAGGGTVIIRGDRLVALPAPGGWLPTGSLTADGLVVGIPGHADTARIERLEVVTSGDPQQVTTGPEQGTYDLALTVQPLVLPAAAALPLGNRIDRLTLEARLMGELARRPWPEALARWRDAGGTVEITRLGIDYGAFRLTGDGTLALDTDGELIAAFSVTAKGLDQAVEALAADGLIAADVAAAARFILTPPGDAGAAGQPAMLRMPISIQNRVLFLGPLPVASVPAVPWRLSRPQ